MGERQGADRKAVGDLGNIAVGGLASSGPAAAPAPATGAHVGVVTWRMFKCVSAKHLTKARSGRGEL
jgi:hypothetical protein